MTGQRWAWAATLAASAGLAGAQDKPAPVPAKPLPVIQAAPAKVVQIQNGPGGVVIIQGQVGGVIRVRPGGGPVPTPTAEPKLADMPPAKLFTPEEFEAGRKKAHDLVRRLGDGRYVIREKAADELVELGRAAKDALLAGRKDADPEVVERCGQILPMALLSDLKLRVDRYKADKEGKLKHDLPLLERYEKLFPADAGTREVFADLVEAGGPSLVRLELEPEAILPAYEQRYIEMCQRSNGQYGGVIRQPSRGEVALLFLLGSDPATQRESGDNVRRGIYPQWIHQAGNTFTDPKSGPLMRKLFSLWLANRSEPNTVQMAVQIIQQHSVKEALPTIAKIMKDGGNGGQPYARVIAMALYARMAAKEDAVKEMTEMLKDETVIQAVNIGVKQGNVQIRDVALAAVILLAGEQPGKFGFENARQPNPMQLQFLQNYYQLGFADDEKRAEARKKWDEAQKAPKKDAPAADKKDEPKPKLVPLPGLVIPPDRKTVPPPAPPQK